LNPDHLAADDFAESFVARGEAMLNLIGDAMGRDLRGGRDVFVGALGSAGFTDMYVDDEEEFDEIAEREYNGEERSDAN
jgi:hypothetical protein